MRFSARLAAAPFRCLTTALVLSAALFGSLPGVTADDSKTPSTANPFRRQPIEAPRQQSSLPLDMFGTLPQVLKPLVVGAIIPPTEGRFVAEGNCWYFVADYPEFAAVIMPQSLLRPIPVNVFREPSGKTVAIDSAEFECTFGPVSGRPSERAAAPANPLRQNLRGRFAFDRESLEDYSREFPERMPVATNLILGRVTDQIIRDKISEGWTVSGEVVDDRGSASLMIHVADRPGSANAWTVK